MSSYDYGHNTPDDAPSGKKQTESEILSWLLIFFCFVVFWPLGLFLLIRKLSGDVYLCAEMYNCQEKVQHEKETGFCY